MKKILHIGKYFPPYMGGMETVLYETVESLKNDFDITVLVSNDSNKYSSVDLGYKVIRVNRLCQLFSTAISPKFPFELKKLDYDLVHIHLPNPTAEISYLLSGNKSKPLVLHFHSDIVKQKILGKIYSPILNKVYSLANKIIAPSPNHINISKYLQKFRDKTVVIPLSIDVNKYDQRDEQKVVYYRSKAEKPILMFVGRLVYYKGIEVLIKAMQEIEAILWIIGSGPLKDDLKSLSKSLLVDDKVNFLGKVTDEEIINRYHACDVFVLPSNANSEMFGMVQLEAMACRKPIVASNLPTGVSWVNQHNETGLLSNVNDSKDLANKINQLLANNELRKKMGENGRIRVEKYFSNDVISKQIKDLYNELL